MTESTIDKYLKEDEDEAKVREARFVGRSPLALAFIRLTRNKVAFACLIIVILFAIAGIIPSVVHLPGLERSAAEYHNSKQIINSVVLLNDDKQIAVSTEDNVLFMYSMENGKKITNFDKHINKVSQVKSFGNDRYLLTVSEDARAFVWDLQKGKGEVISSYRSDIGPMRTIAISADEKRVFIGSVNPFIYELELPSLTPVRTIPAGSKFVTLLNKDTQLLSADNSGNVTIRNVSDALEVLSFKANDIGVTALTVSTDQKTVIISGMDDSVAIWDLATGTKIAENTDFALAPASYLYSKDGSTIFAGGQDGTIYQLDSKTLGKQKDFTGHTGNIYSLSWAKDGSLVSAGAELKLNKTGGNDFAVNKWNLDTGDRKKVVGLSESLRFIPIGDPEHWFGTDEQGRDILARTILGIQTALFLGFVSCMLTIPLSIVIGSLAGYFGGIVDDIALFLMSVITAIPSLIFIFSFILIARGSDFVNNLSPDTYTFVMLLVICISFAITNWVGLARMIRGTFIQAREFEYVLAAKSLGASDFRLIFKHILPNVFHFVIVSFVLEFIGVIRGEVFLAFVGLSVSTRPTWGSMITISQSQIVNNEWQNLFAPTLFMFVFITAMNIFGDALRDALDPKLRNI